MNGSVLAHHSPVELTALCDCDRFWSSKLWSGCCFPLHAWRQQHQGPPGLWHLAVYHRGAVSSCAVLLVQPGYYAEVTVGRPFLDHGGTSAVCYCSKLPWRIHLVEALVISAALLTFCATNYCSFPQYWLINWHRCRPAKRMPGASGALGLVRRGSATENHLIWQWNTKKTRHRGILVHRAPHPTRRAWARGGWLRSQIWGSRSRSRTSSYDITSCYLPVKPLWVRELWPGDVSLY